MAEITDKERQIISITEKFVCKYFNITIDNIVRKDLTNNTVMARNNIFYILHDDMGISISKIAARYSRDERSVKAQLAKTRFCVDKSHQFRDIHAELMNKIEAAL